MSDTSPKDQDALLAGHVRPDAQPRKAVDHIWRVTKYGRVIGCVLRNDERVGGGWDCIIVQDGELSFSRRCLTEEHARFVAAATVKDHLNAGWTEVAARQ
jgi:hypothetical protein